MKKTSYTPADLNNGFVVAISIEAKPGEADAVGAILQGLVSPTTAEPGVKLFLPYRSPDNPSLFFIYEIYVDESDWQKHQDTDHFKESIADLVPRTVKRERIPFIPYFS